MDPKESSAIVEQCLPLLSRDFPRWVIKKETDLPFTKSIIKEALRLEFLARKEEDKDHRTLLAICWMELSHFIASDDAQLLKRYEDAIAKGQSFPGSEAANRISERIRFETDQLAVDLAALQKGVVVERHPDAKPWEFTIKLSKNENTSSEK